MKKQIKAPSNLIAELTKDLGLETLETRSSDDLDFHNLAVWQIKAALVKAYSMGAIQGVAHGYAAASTEELTRGYKRYR